MEVIIDDENRPLRVIQITDIHLGKRHGDDLLGMDADESLSDVLDLLNAENQEYDLVVVTGDITAGDHLQAYQRFLESVEKSLRAPFFCLTGNHDSLLLLKQALIPNPWEKIIDIGRWRIIMLDSSVFGEVYGELAIDELNFLRRALQQSAGRYVMVCLHHQPVPVGSAWVDAYVLKNAGDFFALLDQFPAVKTVVWGHVHQEFYLNRNGVELYSTPATCIQFAPQQDSFGVDHKMPGYRWFTLQPDGSLETRVSRVPEKDYGVDYESKGY